MRKIHITRLAAAGIAGALAVASIATAADKKATAKPAVSIADTASLPKFANARMINLPAPVAMFPASSTQSVAMRAYVDPNTGELRSPTQEDLAKGASSKSAVAKNAKVAAAGRSAAAAVPGPAVTVKANGARTAIVDEKFMTYAVVHVMPDGSISQECVDGIDNAQKAMKAPATVKGVDRHEK